MTVVAADVPALVASLREQGTDAADVEAKASTRALPKSVRETLSAFSNDHGGTLILGLAEEDGFATVKIEDPSKIRDDLASLCADVMEPPVRADIEIVPFEGESLVVASIPELPPERKPCYVKDSGLYTGSFTRTGDGDRHLTQYEVGVLIANRGQPRDDIEPVAEASISDLDSVSLGRLLARVRERQPFAFAEQSDESVMQRLRILVDHQGQLVPSLAGLLALGVYPQQFFPQLNITFVSVPAKSKDQVLANAPRFLDNQTINGSIPAMVRESLRIITRNMSTRANVTGEGREDSFDYPLEALREAVVNALLHRDYSPGSRGTQVQVEMYQDRLMIRNAGGLFGTVTEEDLGGEGVSSSRNSFLSILLTETAIPGTERVVVENRGSGIPAMLATLRRAGMTTPVFTSRIASFSVTFPKHSLLGEETLSWINGLGGGLSEAQCMALALMREGRTVTNSSLRQLGLDSRDATAALVGLVDRNLARSSNGRRYAQYELAPSASSGAGVAVRPQAGEQLSFEDAVVPRAKRAQRLEQVFALFTPEVSLSAVEVARQIGVSERSSATYLSQLIREHRLEATAPPRSPRRRYQLRRS